MEENEIVKKLSKKYNKGSKFIKLLIKISKTFNNLDYYKEIDSFLSNK